MLNDKPVFLFTGFLGSGKTEFIQDTLANPEFGNDGRTLLVVCEYGELEYEPEKFAGPGVEIVQIMSEEELKSGALIEAVKKAKRYDRVIVEYNGMWMLESLWQSMPRNWVLAQEMTLIDTTTFEIYNKNMRQLSFDKLKTAEMVVFNRFTHGQDKMPFHKEVRIANRRSMIIYEYGPHDMEVDDIVDPLPYDMSRKSIELQDDWYAEFYRDINENQDDYDGKTITYKGRVALVDQLPDGMFAFGRHVMTCCEDDIQFAALMAYATDTSDLKVGDWVEVTAKIRVEYEKAYGEKGPVLHCKSVKPCEPCSPQVATF